MDRLYAPWRSEYHLKKRTECVFCDIRDSENDDENYIFYRDEVCFFVMNKYPYNPGHFMIIPNKHTANLEDLSEDEICHIAKMSQKGVKILKAWGADGINLGFNLGIDGGAGIPEHIHMQLVPRFRRDTNFMTTIGDSRVYSRDFDKVYQEIKDISRKYLIKK
jgi:diadenosine tetraphosphate (Ap4A) HIT family hydrolase